MRAIGSAFRKSKGFIRDVKDELLLQIVLKRGSPYEQRYC